MTFIDKPFVAYADPVEQITAACPVRSNLVLRITKILNAQRSW